MAVSFSVLRAWVELEPEPEPVLGFFLEGLPVGDVASSESDS